jgi:multiple sugar transport system substrate-binding protein
MPNQPDPNLNNNPQDSNLHPPSWVGDKAPPPTPATDQKPVASPPVTPGFSQALQDISEKTKTPSSSPDSSDSLAGISQTQTNEDLGQTKLASQVSQGLNQQTSPLTENVQQQTQAKAQLEQAPPFSQPTQQETVSPTPNIEGSVPPSPPDFSAPQAPTKPSGQKPIGTGLRPKKPKLGLILGIVLAMVAIGAGFFLISNLLNKGESGSGDTEAAKTASKPQVNLTYWGLWEPQNIMNEIITDYQRQNPHVNINYSQQSIKDYRERLQSSIATGQGPDIMRYHNTWLPMLKNDLQPDSDHNISMGDYFQVVTNDATIQNEVFGVPLGFDSLALYYNPNLFQKAGLSQPPKDWTELRDYAKKLVIRDGKTRALQVGGVALGTTNNVDHFSDILGLMLLQNGANPSSPSDDLTRDTLLFYTLFKSKDRVWDETMPASTYAFATEKVAMMFAPSWRAHEIAQINPDLQFKTAIVPQLPGEKVAWASYWLEGVSRQSSNSREAWKFLAFLSKDENLQKLYTAQSAVRSFGEPYPKKSLAQSLSTDPVVGAFVAQGQYSKSWYLCARTFDNGLNDRIIKYYENSINSILGGSSPQSTLPTLENGVNQVLSQYGLARATNTNTQYNQESTSSAQTN